MSIESKELQVFVKKCILPHLTHYKESKFSKISEKFLEKIFKNIQLGEHEYKKTIIISRNIDNNYIPKGTYYNLCPDSMKKYIENMNSTGKTFSFSIDNRNFKVYLIYENKNNKDFENSIKRIYIILYLLQIYSRKECSQCLTIYLYLTNIKKTLNDCNIGTCIIGQNNVNTAFTFPCKKNNEIYLYRKEEWFKVLSHELIHSFGLEFSLFDCEYINNQIYKIFPIKTDLRLYESYTEIWGELLNIMFYSYFSLKDREHIGKIIKKTEKIIQLEKVFSIFQSSKILTHFGLSYNDLFEKNHNAIINRRLYNESTPVFSYFIIKNILMFYLNDFLEWCSLINGDSIDFKKTDEIILKKNIEGFIDFIKKYHNHTDFVLCMQEMRGWFFNNNNICNKNNEFIKTMRMSIIE